MRHNGRLHIKITVLLLSALFFPVVAHAEGLLSADDSLSLYDRSVMGPYALPAPQTYTIKDYNQAGPISPLLSGAASFMADRAQQELAAWLLEDILSELCEQGAFQSTGTHASKADGPHSEYLFPHLCRLRKAVSGIAVPFKQAITEAFILDLSGLPGRLLEVAGFQDDSAELLASVSVQLITLLLADKEGPMHAIASIRDISYPTECTTSKRSVPGPCLLKALGEVAEVYLEYPDTFDPMDPSTMATYVSSALHQRKVTDPKLLAAAVRNAAALLKQLHERFLDPYARMTDSGNHARAYAQFQAASAVATLLEALLKCIDYQGGFTEKVEYEILAFRVMASVESGEIASALVPLVDLMDRVSNEYRSVPREIRQFVPIALALASAKDDVSVDTTLESVSSPAGAWRIKRAECMVSIGGLVGISGSRELAKAPDGARSIGWAGSVFAPVGFDFSAPCGKSTCGLFASVLDLGSLVGARLASDRAETIESVESTTSTEKVISPGAYVRFGLGNSPLVFSMGGSWSPDLREFTVAGGEKEAANALRVGIQFSVDIPMFPLL